MVERLDQACDRPAPVGSEPVRREEEQQVAEHLLAVLDEIAYQAGIEQPRLGAGYDLDRLRDDYLLVVVNPGSMSAVEFRCGRLLALAQLAEACGKADSIDEGFAAIDEALDLLQRDGAARAAPARPGLGFHAQGALLRSVQHRSKSDSGPNIASCE